MITPTWYPTNKQLRQFAVISLVGFPLVGAVVSRFAWQSRTFTVFAAIGAALFVIGMIRPKSIRLVYAGLIALTLPIGWLVSNIMLRLIYYVIFTPVGLVFRMIGRDPLAIGKPAGDSYWRDVRPSADLAGYYRQA
ncbi:MAG: SxtJ family membrane protein [Phycisphaerae bacterium]